MNDLLRANVDAAVYINLDERKDKRVVLERRFKELNIEVERFSAVRAGKPLYSNWKTPFLSKRRIQELPRSGCDQSHWTVLTDLWKRDVECALVFEDDVVLPENFVDGLIHIKSQLPEGWWAVRLGWHDSLNKTVLEQTNTHIGKRKKPCCTNSILYSKEGIEQVRRRMMVPYGIIEETFWLMEAKGNLPVYAVTPHPLTGICDLTSDITGKKPLKGKNIRTFSSHFDLSAPSKANERSRMKAKLRANRARRR